MPITSVGETCPARPWESSPPTSRRRSCGDVLQTALLEHAGQTSPSRSSPYADFAEHEGLELVQ